MPLAYLAVRLCDGTTLLPPPPRPPPSLPPSETDFSDEVSRRESLLSVKQVLYATCSNPSTAKALVNRGIPVPPLANSAATRIAAGQVLGEQETKELRTQLVPWLHIAFPAPNDMRRTLDLRLARRYRHSSQGVPCGNEILVCADMLYNMPAARFSKEQGAIYKTCFSYLRAKRGPFPAEKGLENPRYILDDMSRFIDWESSSARCPVYLDDFATVRCV